LGSSWVALSGLPLRKSAERSRFGPNRFVIYIGFALPLLEKALIARIRRQAHAGNRVLTGIGDDCAVLRLPLGHEVLVTTDFSLEGIHFRREWHAAESVGHRCLTRGLSDIAAMGGEPIAAFLSLAMPTDSPQKWVDGFMRGFLTLARRFEVSLAGGDTAESPDGILADIVVLGSVPRGKAILRSGARPGDRIYVSGTLGGSAAALERMRAKPKSKLNPRDFTAHFFPEPRLRLGRALREEGLASAMIDLSDGFSTDLGHICEESGVGAEVEKESIPRAVIGKPAQKVDLRFALHGGEDYELLFTAPRGRRIPARIAGVPVTQIGHIVPGKKVFITSKSGEAQELVPKGWQHFARK
jgi:thiamine-monophosphate kinase